MKKCLIFLVVIGVSFIIGCTNSPQKILPSSDSSECELLSSDSVNMEDYGPPSAASRAETNLRSDCFVAMGIKNKDSSLCLKSNYPNTSEYRNWLCLSIATKNLTYCNKYPKSKSGINYKEISQENCLLAYALEYNNESLCFEISDYDIRTSCIVSSLGGNDNLKNNPQLCKKLIDFIDNYEYDPRCSSSAFKNGINESSTESERKILWELYSLCRPEREELKNQYTYGCS